MAFIRNAQRSAAVVFVHNIWESLGLINVSTSRNFNLFVWEQNCYSWPDHQTLLFISDPKHCCFALKFPLILFSFICCADGWCAVRCLMCAVVGCEALNKMLSIPSPGPASSYNKYNSLDRCYNVLQYHNVAIQTNWIQYSRTQWAGQTGVTFNTQPWTWASEALHSLVTCPISRRRLHKSKADPGATAPSGDRGGLRLSAYVPNSEPKLRPYRYKDTP